MAFKFKVREGKNPKTGQAMFYAQADKVNPVSIYDFAEEIAHSTTVTEADVKAVITEFEVRLMKHFQNNESVRLESVGSFCPRMRSTAARLPEEFTAANIKGMGVQFTPSSHLKYALSAQNPEVKFTRLQDEE